MSAAPEQASRLFQQPVCQQPVNQQPAPANCQAARLTGAGPAHTRTGRTPIQLGAALLAGLLLAGLPAPGEAALLGQQVDLTPGGAVVDGVLSPSEYGPGNSYSFSGGGTGLGGVLNGGNRFFFNSNVLDLFIAFAPGAALDHVVVLYLDSRSGGFSDATLDDESTPDRRVVTELGAAGDDGFPFEADFALRISAEGCTLYELTSGVLNVVPITAACATDTSTSLREISVRLAALGITHGGRAVDFFAAYCRTDLFNSNETVPPMPVINQGPNPGADAVVMYDAFSRFITWNNNPRLLISQVYGGGGGTGALLTFDFVELHNPGPGYVSMTNWSLQNASASGSAWQVTPISGFLPPGGYYLVTFAAAGQGLGIGSLTDRSTSIALPIADGKIALCNNSTPLTGNPGCPFPASVVDFIGYGVANTREPCTGTAADNAPAGTNVLSLQRRGCGRQDTDRNSADWSLGFPTPRNSQTLSAGELSVSGLVSPHIARSGETVLLRVAPRDCLSGGLASGPVSVTALLTAIGGPAELALRDDGLGGDEQAGDGVYSAAVSLGSLSPGPRWLPIRLSDGVAEGAGYLGIQVAPVAAPLNDNCTTAQPIPGPFNPPVDVFGNLTDGSVEYNAIVAISGQPASAMSARRGQWFAVNGTGTSLTASLCPTSPAFDSVLIVLCGTCEGLTVVASADDVSTAECPLTAQAVVRWCSLPDVTYYVWVATFSVAAPTQTFTLRLSDDGIPCKDARGCDTCDLPAGDYQSEGEPPWGPGLNEGCDGTSGRFRDVTFSGAPLMIRGSSYSFGDSVDPDWYRFQAPESGLLSATLTAQFSGRVALWRLGTDGRCDGRVLLASSLPSARCGAATLTGALAAGAWYGLRVTPESAPTQLGGVAPGPRSANYALTLQVGAPPLNDRCSSAAPLVLGAPPLAGTTRGATSDQPSACDPSGRDVWYRVQTLQPGQLRIDTCGSEIAAALAVYAGGCDELLEIACVEACPPGPCSGPPDCLTTPDLPPGVYTVRVSDRGIDAGGIFQLRATFALENDLCADALELPLNAAISGTTVTATTDGGLPACAGPVAPGGGGGFGYTAGGVWYRFTPPGVGVVTVDTLTNPTAGGGYDTRLTAFSGSCSGLVCVTANDDVDALTRRSKIALHVVPEEDYYILVHGFGSQTGSFVLTATFDPPLENDECDAPTVLPGEAGSLAGTLRGATAPNFPAAGFPSCSTPYGLFDVWYRYTPDCDGLLTLDTCGPYDTLLSVHSACPTTLSAGQLTPLGATCNRDGPIGCAPGAALSVTLTAQQPVLIRVAGQNAAEPGQAFTLNYAYAKTLPAAPASIQADRPTVCPGDSGDVVLTALGGSGATLVWRLGDCEAGELLGTGPSLVVPAPAAPTTFFARWESSCGDSGCASLTIVVSAAVRGDSDGNGLVDFDDIGCFVSAMIDPAAWQTCGTLHPAAEYRCVNDANGDGQVNFDDIGAFVSCLVEGGCP